jgi:hypothetical protein
MFVLLVADSHPPVPKQHHQTGAGKRGPQETDLRSRGCGELPPPPHCFSSVVFGLNSSRIMNGLLCICTYTFWVLFLVRPHISKSLLLFVLRDYLLPYDYLCMVLKLGRFGP